MKEEYPGDKSLQERYWAKEMRWGLSWKKVNSLSICRCDTE